MNKKLIKSISLCIAFVALTFSVMAQNTIYKQDLSIFPKPEAGYKQMIIDVPHSAQDGDKKIEFFVGKYMEVDACNHFNLMGTLERQDLQGWGYTYYTFKTEGQVMSTQMGCLDDTKRTIFVSASPEMVRYNGQLPIVVYIPEGYDLQFKIYKAEADTYRASENRTK